MRRKQPLFSAKMRRIALTKPFFSLSYLRILPDSLLFFSFLFYNVNTFIIISFKFFCFLNSIHSHRVFSCGYSRSRFCCSLSSVIFFDNFDNTKTTSLLSHILVITHQILLSLHYANILLLFFHILYVSLNFPTGLHLFHKCHATFHTISSNLNQ